MEEITLSVPSTYSESPATPPRSQAHPDEAEAGLERLARGFQAAVLSRDRFALTERSRRQRHATFELQLKRLIKATASDTARAVPDRRTRAGVRARSYAAMMVLARLVADDHARTARRCRGVLRWAMGAVAIGSLGIVFTLIANGWLPAAAGFRP